MPGNVHSLTADGGAGAALRRWCAVWVAAVVVAALVAVAVPQDAVPKATASVM